jgi:hypothetical protein
MEDRGNGDPLRQGRIFLTLPHMQTCSAIQPCHQFNWYLVRLPQDQSTWGVHLTTHLHLEPSLRMYRTIHSTCLLDITVTSYWRHTSLKHSPSIQTQEQTKRKNGTFFAFLFTQMDTIWWRVTGRHFIFTKFTLLPEIRLWRQILGGISITFRAK